jgi:NAD(P)-dependent dehydrogenase (short-subunit alcohol dehydrogenase family)
MDWKLTIPEAMQVRLHAHLFPGDRDEHGAVILAGIQHRSDGSLRLLARQLALATDGVDYVPGRHGYRMLRAEFLQHYALQARDESLAYIAVHNHPGRGNVGFSDDDLASQRRGYPALLALTGTPVGALVFSEDSVAGNLYVEPDRAQTVSSCTVVGRNRVELVPKARVEIIGTNPMRAQQALLLGGAGLARLRRLRVGVIGAGGVGSVLVELLARLGVGTIIVTDPQRVALSNLSRLLAARRLDALSLLCDPRRPPWMRRLGERFARTKVSLAKRNARRADPSGTFIPIVGDIRDPHVAAAFVECDYLFLAADSMQARLVFNALVHQYLIPGVQLGSKAPVDAKTGTLGDVFSVCRPVTPDAGCLSCNELIPAWKLQEEIHTPAERRAQRYVDDEEVAAPSVITLNAIAAAHAANDFLFYATGLTNPDAITDYRRFVARARDVRFDEPQSLASCLECGTHELSRRAKGDGADLPTKERRA